MTKQNWGHMLSGDSLPEAVRKVFPQFRTFSEATALSGLTSSCHSKPEVTSLNLSWRWQGSSEFSSPEAKILRLGDLHPAVQVPAAIQHRSMQEARCVLTILSKDDLCV